MERIVVMIFLWVFITQGALAQCAKMDSLYRVLRVAKSPTDSINTLNALAATLLEIRKEAQAALVLRKSLEMAEKARYPKGVADALTHIAVIHYQDLFPLRTTIRDYQQAYQIYQDLGDQEQMIKMLEIMGAYYAKSPDTESQRQALAYYEQSLSLRRQDRDSLAVANLYETIGELYATLEQDAEALSALELAEQIRLSQGEENHTHHRLLTRYRRIQAIEAKIEASDTVLLTIGFGLVLGILGVLTIIAWQQRNRAYKQLKQNNQNLKFL
ncbi:MAG: hypothetical protein HC880_10725 [Bacteroidia bacterium]|nr:hypothetical protein [Bacteroidia bacterium]